MAKKLLNGQALKPFRGASAAISVLTSGSGAASSSLRAYSWWEYPRNSCGLKKNYLLSQPVPDGALGGGIFTKWKSHVINAKGTAGPVEYISDLEVASTPKVI